MTFEEALIELRNDKKIRRNLWIKDSVAFSWFVDKDSCIRLMVGDVLATDWEVVAATEEVVA